MNVILICNKEYKIHHNTQRIKRKLKIELKTEKTKRGNMDHQIFSLLISRKRHSNCFTIS